MWVILPITGVFYLRVSVGVGTFDIPRLDRLELSLLLNMLSYSVPILHKTHWNSTDQFSPIQDPHTIRQPSKFPLSPIKRSLAITTYITAAS